MLLVVPSIDILVHEQTEFVKRVQREVREAEEAGTGGRRRIEMKFMEGGFHGWLECKFLMCFSLIIVVDE